MPTRDPVLPTTPERGLATASPPRGRTTLLPFTGGGTAGNEQLTTMTGVMLIGMLAVLGVTILRIGQLISVHLFVGLLLLGPVGLKLAATGYRFARYYAGNATYRHKGPPELILRLLAPLLVLTTVIVFASGIVLMFLGPSHRDQWLFVHKASFIVWLGACGLHVLGHLPRLGRGLRGGRENAAAAGRSPGAAGRWIALAGAVVGGLVLAIVLIPHFGAWTSNTAFLHHDH